MKRFFIFLICTSLCAINFLFPLTVSASPNALSYDLDVTAMNYIHCWNVNGTNISVSTEILQSTEELPVGPVGVDYRRIYSSQQLIMVRDVLTGANSLFGLSGYSNACYIKGRLYLRCDGDPGNAHAVVYLKDGSTVGFVNIPLDSPWVRISANYWYMDLDQVLTRDSLNFGFSGFRFDQCTGTDFRLMVDATVTMDNADIISVPSSSVASSSESSSELPSVSTPPTYLEQINSNLTAIYSEMTSSVDTSGMNSGVNDIVSGVNSVLPSESIDIPYVSDTLSALTEFTAVTAAEVGAFFSPFFSASMDVTVAGVTFNPFLLFLIIGVVIFVVTYCIKLFTRGDHEQ